MTYTAKDFLVRFRGYGRCELCGPLGICGEREPHHIIARGQGGADTLNLPLNLVGLGCCWCCGHHRQFHDGRVDRWDVFEAVARREGLQPGFVESRLWQMVRAPKECRPCPHCWGAGSVRIDRPHRRALFSRHECVRCDGVGILTAAGEVYVELARVFH